MYVAGVGVISAIGITVDETLQSLKSESSGIAHITLFDSVYRDKLPVGEVKLSNAQLCEKLSQKSHITRTALLDIKQRVFKRKCSLCVGLIISLTL